MKTAPVTSVSLVLFLAFSFGTAALALAPSDQLQSCASGMCPWDSSATDSTVPVGQSGSQSGSGLTAGRPSTTGDSTAYVPGPDNGSGSESGGSGGGGISGKMIWGGLFAALGAFLGYTGKIFRLTKPIVGAGLGGIVGLIVGLFVVPMIMGLFKHNN